jgi:plasmid stability protein
MAQVIVRNLEDTVSENQRRAARHGRSMEEKSATYCATR